MKADYDIEEFDRQLESLVGEFNEDDDERYVLTPWGCLACVLEDYNIDTNHITGKMGEHIVEDFMELMENAGYVTKE